MVWEWFVDVWMDGKEEDVEQEEEGDREKGPQWNDWRVDRNTCFAPKEKKKGIQLHL